MSNTLTIEGSRTTGNDVRTQNVQAALAIANVLKSSLGPVGLDKMIVDKAGEVTITNDGATILKKLEIEHPAAKVLVDLAHLQDQEVGDGTTSVVLLAAELLRRANELIKMKIHPSSIIAGYRLALEAAVKFMDEHLRISSDELSRDHIISAAKTSMSSKIIGSEADFFADIAVRAMENVKTVRQGQGKDGPAKAIYPVKAVNIIKCHGRSSVESELVDGYALRATRASQGMPSSITDAKIALLDFNLGRHRLKLGIQVVINDPNELEKLQQRELDLTKERIQSIISAGANVIICSKGIDDVCLKYFVEAGAIAVRRVPDDDMKRISKATGGHILITLADMEGGERFDPAWLGHAREVVEQRVGDNEVLFIKGCAKTSAQTIILRGANDYMVDEMDRSLHDSLNVVKRVLESNSLVAGGGSVEAALSVYLEKYSTEFASREQLAIYEFAQALLTIPKTLSVNAALDATELISQLRAHHADAQKENANGSRAKNHYGLDLLEGKIRDNLAAGVLEPSMSKVKSLRFATEAAVSIIRIDDLIKMNPSSKPGNKGPRQ